MSNNERDRLIQLLRKKAVIRKSIRLSSGRSSSYYIDAKMVTTDPEGIYLTGKLVLEKVRSLRCEATAVGGLTLGAVPIAAAVSYSSHVDGGVPLRSFIVRKEAKEHGTQRMIEGDLSRGEKVLIVDDVVTTGKSVLEAIRQVENVGCEVEAVVCLVDREEGGQGDLRRRYRCYSICSKAELGIVDENTAASDQRACAAGAVPG